MSNITKPLPFNELQAKPDIPSLIRLSDDMQQTLALLVGYNGSQRKLVSVSSNGILMMSSVRPKAVINITGSGTDDDWQGTDIKCSEVKVISNPDNAGRIWVNIDAVAAADTGEPLDAGDYLVWGIENLTNLHIHIVTDGNKVIVVYG